MKLYRWKMSVALRARVRGSNGNPPPGFAHVMWAVSAVGNVVNC